MVFLLINGGMVAQAEVNDLEDPSNLSLIYRGSIPIDSEVAVMAFSPRNDFFIPPQELQYGYKLYGPGYNLLSEPDTTCLN